MISFFTIPKAFTDAKTAVAQTNAISSWKHALPNAEILVFGDEAGIGEAVAAIGARHVPHIERNELGTPLLSSAFADAERLATHAILCYVNADIILTPDFATTVRRIDAPAFLMIGRRTNVDLPEAIDFSAPWIPWVVQRGTAEGKLEAPWGSDFFAFVKGTGFGSLPPFAVGRPNWDNWMIARARTLGLPVFDATPACMVVHQNHGYGHVRHARGNAWEGPEGDRNRDLAGAAHRYTVLDADYRLLPDRIAPVTRGQRFGLQLWHSAMKRLPQGISARLARYKL